MAFIALKPCSLGGKLFRVGEVVPDSFVFGDRLVRFGVLRKAAEGQQQPVVAAIDDSGKSQRLTGPLHRASARSPSPKGEARTVAHTGDFSEGGDSASPTATAGDSARRGRRKRTVKNNGDV